MSTTTLITAEELARMPRDNFRYELIRGELRQMSPAGIEHGKIEGSIFAHLRQNVMNCDLGLVFPGDTGFCIASNPDSVRSPDVAYVSHERLNLITDQRSFAPVAPDLAIEVLSPSDTPVKVAEKIADWLRAGTLAVIVVNPRRRTVDVHQPAGIHVELTEADDLKLPGVVPGWVMPVCEIFK